MAGSLEQPGHRQEQFRFFVIVGQVPGHRGCFVGDGEDAFLRPGLLKRLGCAREQHGSRPWPAYGAGAGQCSRRVAGFRPDLHDLSEDSDLACVVRDPRKHRMRFGRDRGCLGVLTGAGQG